MQKIDSFSGEYDFLSNFYPLKDKTVEHWFQAMKTRDEEQQEWVLTAPTPGAAKKRGRKVTLREDWNDIRLEVMEMCLREKFSDPVLCQKLLDTGDAELIEGNTWNDTFWGVCRGKGENNLGKLLMELRTRLRNEKDPDAV